MPADSLPRTPSFSLEGKRALVTGGSRGIGLAAAAALAGAGAAVTLTGRDGESLAAAAGKIGAAGGSAAALALDMADVETVREALDGAMGEDGPFDVLVNNAGTSRPNMMVDVSPEDFDVVMGLNVRGAFFCAQTVAKALLAAGRPGSIINVSSQMGLVGGARRSLYCASKFAVEGFTKSMAIELGPAGIRVNSLCPTFFETDLTRKTLSDPAMRADIVGRIPMGRVGQVDELMGAVLFLASDASSLVTGSSLTVDGGWTAI